MQIVVLRESDPTETRVALMPESVARLMSLEVDVVVEAGAGRQCGVADSEYVAAGASVSDDRITALAGADVLLSVGRPAVDDLFLTRRGTAVVGMLRPFDDPAELSILRERSITGLSLDLLPRSARFQPMDANATMATVAGYKAVLLAATRLPRIFPLLMTSAGTLPPARILVVGTQVAGLQAVATARRLGAVVEVFDLKPTARDEVTSLGATFLSGPREIEGEDFYDPDEPPDDAALHRAREIVAAAAHRSDAVILAAHAPGAPAPRILTRDAVAGMRRGAVVVDLAGAGGGNCECSDPGRVVDVAGVVVMAPLNLPASVPEHASQLYGRNVVAFLKHVLADGSLKLDLNDEVVASTCLTHQGRWLLPRVEAAVRAAGGR